ncbi:MAG: VTT domain-containing protein [Candidatus Pacebacteria bacterium]|nr:VTT domain-containing protein [Candidatus Paceibacterota bacterium]
MLELIQQFAPYAPFIIFMAAALDIFFVTGLILYGAAMISTIAAMYAGGLISLEMIALSAYIGTVFGNTINYGAGRLFKEAPFVAKRLQQPSFTKARSMLQNRGLPIFMVVSRFIALIRPLYALLLGSLEISFKRFIFYELVIALFWVTFWMFIIIKGGTLYLYLTS